MGNQRCCHRVVGNHRRCHRVVVVGNHRRRRRVVGFHRQVQDRAVAVVAVVNSRLCEVLEERDSAVAQAGAANDMIKQLQGELDTTREMSTRQAHEITDDWHQRQASSDRDWNTRVKELATMWLEMMSARMKGAEDTWRIQLVEVEKGRERGCSAPGPVGRAL